MFAELDVEITLVCVCVCVCVTCRKNVDISCYVSSESSSFGPNVLNFFVVVALLFYVHGKHLRSCRDGQLTQPHFSWAGLDLLSG